MLESEELYVRKVRLSLGLTLGLSLSLRLSLCLSLTNPKPKPKPSPSPSPNPIASKAGEDVTSQLYNMEVTLTLILLNTP